MKKICAECHIEKQLSEFSPKKGGKLGVTKKCKPCANAERKGLKPISDETKQKHEAIRKEYLSGSTNQKIAYLFGMHPGTISTICKGLIKPVIRREQKRPSQPIKPFIEKPLKGERPKPEMKVYNIKDLPEEEQARINAMFKPYEQYKTQYTTSRRRRPSEIG